MLEVLLQLQDIKLIANKEKRNINLQKIEHLGYVISEGIVFRDPTKKDSVIYGLSYSWQSNDGLFLGFSFIAIG